MLQLRTPIASRSKKATQSCVDSCGHAPNVNSNHPDHSRNLSRLRRVQGQLEGVSKMILERRYCPEILQQLRAAGAALKGLEASVLELHFRSCIQNAAHSKNPAELDQKLEELMKLFIKS